MLFAPWTVCSRRPMMLMAGSFALARCAMGAARPREDFALPPKSEPNPSAQFHQLGLGWSLETTPGCRLTRVGSESKAGYEEGICDGESLRPPALSGRESWCNCRGLGIGGAGMA